MPDLQDEYSDTAAAQQKARQAEQERQTAAAAVALAQPLATPSDLAAAIGKLAGKWGAKTRKNRR